MKAMGRLHRRTVEPHCGITWLSERSWYGKYSMARLLALHFFTHVPHVKRNHPSWRYFFLVGGYLGRHLGGWVEGGHDPYAPPVYATGNYINMFQVAPSTE